MEAKGFSDSSCFIPERGRISEAVLKNCKAEDPRGWLLFQGTWSQHSSQDMSTDRSSFYERLYTTVRERRAMMPVRCAQDQPQRDTNILNLDAGVIRLVDVSETFR